MSVLRLEQATDGEVFTIATYHKEDFDQQLFKVGCDYCLDPEELIAPILSDRKSTRLNSSHVVISYAVFCLKKKTKK